jgi:regulator of RNase E activity RraA
MNLSKMTFEELIERYRKVGSADASDALGDFGAMDSEIKPLLLGSKIVGPALTVKPHPGDELTVIDAISNYAKAGDVIAIEGREICCAAFGGGIMWGSCWRIGVEGVVIDGATRDLDQIRSYPFPVFARCVTPTECVAEKMGEINVPIQCGGVNVYPGDIIIGDTDGVVVIPRERGETTLKIAEAIAKIDNEAIRMFKSKTISVDQIWKRVKEGYKNIEELKRNLKIDRSKKAQAKTDRST